ncbi:MAG: DUF4380 domain-containing protein [Turicibacter sp.]|nr:DUF4380 domain-containing protein [Turicibacter sp.]
MEITTIKNEHFGECMVLSNDSVELHVTMDIGPRIIHCALKGKENMFFQDKEKATLGDKYDIFADQFKLYGGHRLWISPEIVPRCYHPDNEPVTATVIEGGMRFTAAIEKHNNIQKSISVTLDEDSPRVKLVHSVRNTGLFDKQFGLWAISMMSAGGVHVMPMPSRQTGFLPNRNFTFWDYTKLNDFRLHFGEKYVTLKQDGTSEGAFKLGYNNEAGWSAYFNHGQVFVKYFEPVLDGFYPDNGCSFETYTNANMLETEVLGEILDIEPDDFAILEEEWELYESDGVKDPQDEAEISAVLAEFM